MPKNKQLESSSGGSSSSDSDSGPDDRTPVPKAKKAKLETPTTKPAGGASSSSKNKNKSGEPTWELEKNKVVTVRTFKGKTYVDIREFYDAGGEMKPGKKGISLTVDQWNKLQNVMPEVNDAVVRN